MIKLILGDLLNFLWQGLLSRICTEHQFLSWIVNVIKRYLR
jgi:hypothetical protein